MRPRTTSGSQPPGRPLRLGYNSRDSLRHQKSIDIMLWFLILVIAALLIWGIMAFNRLVAQRNTVFEAWAGIDVQLTRRYDLVPSLVETVRGYRSYESDVLKEITELRTSADSSAARRSALETRLSDRIVKLFALAEDYPDLKADENFQQLHQSLVDIEDDLQYARRYYNGAVRDNNNLVEGFPSLIVARLFGFGSREFFEIDVASKRTTPMVQL